MLIWITESSWGLNSGQRTTGKKRIAKSGENRLPQGRSYQLVTQYQMFISENIYTRNIRGTVHVVSRSKHTHTPIYICEKIKKDHEFEKEQEMGVWESLNRLKRKKKLCNCNLKIFLNCTHELILDNPLSIIKSNTNNI